MPVFPKITWPYLYDDPLMSGRGFEAKSRAHWTTAGIMLFALAALAAPATGLAADEPSGRDSSSDIHEICVCGTRTFKLTNTTPQFEPAPRPRIETTTFPIAMLSDHRPSFPRREDPPAAKTPAKTDPKS